MDLDMLERALRGRRVAVTGHTGFKGGWLVHWLSALGAEVHGFALAPDTTPSLFDVARVEPRCATHTLGDVRDRHLVAQWLGDLAPDVVLHLAAQPIVLSSYEDPVWTLETNVQGTWNVLDAVRNTPSVHALVNVTSDKCYDNREWVWGYRESDPLGGHDPYSASKGAAEVVFGAYQRSFFSPRSAFGAASVRAGNVIGGGDWAPQRIVPDIVRALTSGVSIPVRRPEAQRPWQHVLEPIGGYLLLAARLLRSPKSFQGAYNFGPRPENARPVRDLVTGMIDAWGGGDWQDRSDPEAPHEAHFLRLAIDKAADQLGWTPRWGFERTVAETVAWYHAHAAGEDMDRWCQRQIAAYASDLRRGPSSPAGTA